MFIMLLTIPALPVSWIRTYTFLSYFVMVGISIAFVGLISIMTYCGMTMHSGTGCDPNDPDKGECVIQTWNTVGVFGHIGFAMFVFEGNAAVINVRAETKNQDQYGKILTTAIILMLSIFIIFSTVAYFTFQGQTNTILSLSFAVTPFTTFIIGCVCINALCSYPVQFLCMVDIIEQHDWFK
jgi:amino acid permease